MNYLSVENLSKQYGEKPLFENLSFGLSRGDKVALIANNGTGKSTLLKILNGKDTADRGKVTLRNGIRIGFLEQDPNFDITKSVAELIKGEDSKITEVVREYERALEAQAHEYNDQTHADFEKASALMDEYQAWDYERKLKMIFSKFGIVNLEQKIGSLSGGQKKRLALALVLLDNPDLLILDEPTNHLDVEMVEWLEDYLTSNQLTLLMVTHDRYFLDHVCNNILEITDGKMYRHEGNYSYFVQKKAEREEVYNVELGKARQLMKKELEWMRKMPKARTTKSKSRITSFYEVEEKATSRKLRQELKLEVKMSRIGGKILEMKKVYKKYGDKVILAGMDYTFKNGERIGIVGSNGAGKTTFLNIITGKEAPDSGKVNTGDTVVYGYYSQMGIELKEDKRVIEVVRDIADVIVLADGSKLSASQFLQHFMFTPDMQFTPVSKLSGGEKRRLYLLTVLIKNPNFLILDEPTNDLDLLTLNKLEDFLSSFGGCLILVSHDRYFMDKLVDTLFIFEGNGKIRNFLGTYAEYREEKDEEEAEKKALESEKKSKAKSIAAEATATKESKKKVGFKEKHEYDTLEKDIKSMESEKTILEYTINDPETTYDELTKASVRLGVVLEALEQKTARWLELAEIIG